MDRGELLKSTDDRRCGGDHSNGSGSLRDGSRRPSGVAAPNLATGIVELRLATSCPDAVAGPADQARRLGQRLAAMTGGRYRIAFATSATGSPPCARAKPTSTTLPSTITLAPIAVVAFFAGLPGDRGIAAPHLSAWMLAGGGQQLWDDLCRRPRRQGHARRSHRRATLLRGVAARRRTQRALAERLPSLVRPRMWCADFLASSPVAMARVADALTRGGFGGRMRRRHRQLRAWPDARRESGRGASTGTDRPASVGDLPLAVGQPGRSDQALFAAAVAAELSWHSPRRRRTGACSIPHPWPPIPGPWRPNFVHWTPVCRGRRARRRLPRARAAHQCGVRGVVRALLPRRHPGRGHLIRNWLQATGMRTWRLRGQFVYLGPTATAGRPGIGRNPICIPNGSHEHDDDGSAGAPICPGRFHSTPKWSRSASCWSATSCAARTPASEALKLACASWRRASKPKLPNRPPGGAPPSKSYPATWPTLPIASGNRRKASRSRFNCPTMAQDVSKLKELLFESESRTLSSDPSQRMDLVFERARARR